MNILIIGGTGFISGRLTNRLLDAGHRVTIVTRGHTPVQEGDRERLEVIRCDRRNSRAFADALSHRTFDVGIDMIAYHPKDSVGAASVLRNRLGRFIHCSTVSVYMVSDDIRCPITEDQDKKPLMEFFPRNPFGMEYGIKKRECEDVLWAAHDEKAFPVTMVRPTYVGGPGDPAKRDFFWIERMLDGGPLLVPGSGDWKFQSVYVEDVVRAIVSLLECRECIGRAYNVAGEETFSLNEYLTMLGNLLGRQPELVHIVQDEFDDLRIGSSPEGDVFTFNTRRSAIFSLERIQRDLKWRSTPFQSWMKETIEWFTRYHKGHSVGYERRAEELDVIRRLSVT